MVSDPFSKLLGQDAAVALLKAAVKHQRIAPAYLLTGAAGVGRRLGAECFLELLLQPKRNTDQNNADRLRHQIQQRNHPDLLWVEPTYLHQGNRLTVAEAAEAGVKKRNPPVIRLEQIREISQFLARPSLEAVRSVVVVESAEAMAEAAANGLLKTLEEPGSATIILISTSEDALLPTLVSRCQHIPFRRLPPEVVTQVLSKTGHTEILEAASILALAQGSPGAAIEHWKQLQAIDPALLSQVQQQPVSLREALTLAQQIAASLAPETQLWLADYLQQQYWQQRYPIGILQKLEQVKQHLNQSVQPRLVWEVMMMSLLSVQSG